MDIRQLGRGATLYLPVQVEQALFSFGDALAKGEHVHLSASRERHGGCPSMRTRNCTEVPRAAGPITRWRSRATRYEAYLAIAVAALLVVYLASRLKRRRAGAALRRD